MDFLTALSKSAALCAQQERCCSEIEEKLLSWDVDKEIVEQVLKKLVEEKYIDESRFAGFYARDKFRFNKWGKQKISWNLHRKKISKDIINDVLNGFDETDYSDTLFLLLKEKERSIAGRDFMKKKAALIRFAVSRGFEYEKITKALDRLL